MSRSLHEYRLERKFQQRLYIFTGLIFLAAMIFVFQLGNLQLVKGYENRILAKKFVSRQEFTVAPRGLVFDRKFQPGDKSPVIYNKHSFDLVIYPARFRKREDAVRYVRIFSGVMGRPFADYAEELEPGAWRKAVRKNESITLLENMTERERERAAVFRLLEEYGELVPKHTRYYAMGPAAAHITGYIGLPTRSQLDQKLALSYQTLGKAGVESIYDTELRGTDGVRIRHRIIDTEEQIAGTEQGNTLVLTVDRDVQAAAYRALKNAGRRGAAVAINAGTGEILALVSHPSFDPNILSSGSAKQRGKHFQIVTQHKAFLNLAIQGKFPPASTFKPLVALAALERAPKQDVTANTGYQCYGRFTLKSTMPGAPDAHYSCWTAGHGHQDMVGAIAHSCNVYFYNLGYHIGSRPIIHFSRALGLDKTTGIDLPGEIAGRVPDQRWKQIHLSSKWYDGDTVNLAIGQGYLEVTPLEMAVLYSSFVNRGKIYRPHVLKEIRDPSEPRRVLRRVQPEILNEVPISLESLETIQAGMRAVVTRGTARRLQQYPVPIAGKTGTAQTRSGVKGKNHAWFAGFAPYGAPPEETVVVVVFVEHGVAGGASAAPVAGEMLNAAFPDWTPQKSKELNDRLQRRERERELKRLEEQELEQNLEGTPDTAAGPETEDDIPLRIKTNEAQKSESESESQPQRHLSL